MLVFGIIEPEAFIVCGAMKAIAVKKNKGSFIEMVLLIAYKYVDVLQGKNNENKKINFIGFTIFQY